jgi:hypothetical protein
MQSVPVELHSAARSVRRAGRRGGLAISIAGRMHPYVLARRLNGSAPGQPDSMSAWRGPRGKETGRAQAVNRGQGRGRSS